MQRKLALLVITAVAVSACGGNRTKDGPGSTRIPDLPPDAVPRSEARSKYGNGPVYEVFGKRYTVMPSANGYQERGVASWYGKKFHGNLTSNREVYDMYAMTAAHKTLPLPTYVRVRNLKNNKSIIVRVNDRGPFVHNRIIDLSYAAAIKLDMVSDGTSMVEVTAIDPRSPKQEQSKPREVVADSIYVQVGAFGDRSNASRRLALLEQSGINNAFVVTDSSGGTPLFRVRIGPVADVVQYDVLVEELENIGILDPYLIAE